MERNGRGWLARSKPVQVDLAGRYLIAGVRGRSDGGEGQVVPRRPVDAAFAVGAQPFRPMIISSHRCPCIPCAVTPWTAYFDFDNVGCVKTATEVTSDNSALMRNIARHEHLLEKSLATISHALLHVSRGFGEGLTDEGDVSVPFDDSIITATAAEKQQDMKEVGVTMARWEFRQKRHGEDEATARRMASEVGADVPGSVG